MREDEKCCGKCRWHLKRIASNETDRHRNDWWCSREESGAYGDFTNFSDACSKFEE